MKQWSKRDCLNHGNPENHTIHSFKRIEFLVAIKNFVAVAKRIIFGIVFLLHFNCITLAGIKIGNAIDGKSKNAESIIQATGLIGLFGDTYLGAVVFQPHPVGVAYAVLAALFYIATDGGISDRLGMDENLQE